VFAFEHGKVITNKQAPTTLTIEDSTSFRPNEFISFLKDEQQ